MKNRFFQLKSFITYWLDAVDEHSLHSPFFFELYTNTLRADPDSGIIDSIEQQRQKLLSDNRRIEVADFGSGSSYSKGITRRISDIARTSLSPRKHSQLYRRIIDHFHFQEILELGTSLGINTLYLASSSGCRVNTFEGSPSIAATAKKLFIDEGAENIILTLGNINDTLPAYLTTVKKIDFAFLDANHRYEPTLAYFRGITEKVHDHSIIILDDIHHSAEMERAWTHIQRHPRVFATADLFRCGLVFFDPALNRRHYVLQF